MRKQIYKITGWHYPTRVVPDEENLKSCTLQCFYPIMSSYNHALYFNKTNIHL